MEDNRYLKIFSSIIVIIYYYLLELEWWIEGKKELRVLGVYSYVVLCFGLLFSVLGFWLDR